MRVFLTALALMLAMPLDLAFAQKAPPPPVAVAQREVSPEGLAAARGVMSLLLVESGAIPYALDRAFAEQLPGMRQSVTTSEVYRDITPAKRLALDAYLDSMPAVANEEVSRGLPAMLDSSAMSMAQVFTDQELIAIHNFVRQRGVREYMIQSVIAGVQGDDAPDQEMTDELMPRFIAFGMTPEGQAFAAKQEQWGAAMEHTIVGGFEAVSPAFEARIIRDICGILGDDCPHEFRP